MAVCVSRTSAVLRHYEGASRGFADNPAEVEQFRAGKEKLFGFFVGQVMRATKGKANPQLVNEILRKKLAG